jgi:hypothetical protein
MAAGNPVLVGIGHEAVMLRPAVFRAAGLHGGILPVVRCAHPGIDGAKNLELGTSDPKVG